MLGATHGSASSLPRAVRPRLEHLLDDRAEVRCSLGVAVAELGGEQDEDEARVLLPEVRKSAASSVDGSPVDRARLEREHLSSEVMDLPGTVTEDE